MRRVSLLLAVLTVAVPYAIVMGGVSIVNPQTDLAEVFVGGGLLLVAFLVGAVLLFATLFALLHPPGLPSPPAQDGSAPDGGLDVDESGR